MPSELLFDIAADYRMDPTEFKKAVMTQCFAGGACSDSQLLMLLSVAKRYDLNPLIRELHAFTSDRQNDAGQKVSVMQIVVGVDGWFKIVSRDPRFLGYKTREHRSDDGKLDAVSIEMYRRDWRIGDEFLPGTYTARMDEWLVEHKPNKGPTNWEEMPEHRLFGVAFKECARRTLGITECIGEADEANLSRATAVGEGSIITPVAEQPRALDYEPRIPANFASASEREKVPVNERPHLRVNLDSVAAITKTGSEAAPPKAASDEAVIPPSAHHESRDGQSEASGTAGQPSTPEKPASCQMKGCVAEAAERVEVNGEKFWMCAVHAKGYKPRRPGRPRKAADAPVTHGPALAPTPAETQRAAGLETIDPNESALETFIRVHDVPEKRVKLALAKYGAEKLDDLDAAAAEATLSVFKKSYGERAV
jgi:hypothetical protein